MEDPIVVEIRKIRDEYAKKFNYNLIEIFNDLKDKEGKLNRRTISRPPKLFLKKSAYY